MPRKARNPAAGLIYRVYNTARTGLPFASESERQDFTGLARRAAERTRVNLVDVSLTPEGYSLLLLPSNGRDMSRYMQWLLSTHHARYSRRNNLNGPIWLGRYKSERIDANNPELLTAYETLQAIADGSD